MKKMKMLCLLLCASQVAVPTVMKAQAAVPPGTPSAMISTGEAVSVLLRVQNRAKVEKFMQREDVRGEFAKFGVDADEASMRVASMTDHEIQKIAGEIDRTPAGADVIVISLTTVLLVVIILLLIGKL